MLSNLLSRLSVAVIIVAAPGALSGQDPILLSSNSMVHLRSGEVREWDTFEAEADGSDFDIEFTSISNETAWTLTLRQQDVREVWDVRLNGDSLGRLTRDENDIRSDFQVPAGLLTEGINRLRIESIRSAVSDDIRVGEIEIHPMTPRQFRGAAEVEVVITNASDAPIPGRITVTDESGALVPLGIEPNSGLAVREGVIYTVDGAVRFGVRPGRYRIMAGRGFEYSVASTRVELQPGELAKRTLRLTREVNTEGWIACDTHVHTVTHSGHGDCTIEERMVTLAGEGIELPIATDHNKQIDYRPTSDRVKTSPYFTPVVGNEVTTKQGHFNVFPSRAGRHVPDHEAENWASLFDSIFSSGSRVRVAILNHGRDLHSGFRPLSPRHHLSVAGRNLDEWDCRYNAMELINSGAVQSDPMELFLDWCGMQNAGRKVTPVGSSDSHDVARYIVGQGRTYIRCEDDNVATIDTDQAVESLLRGEVIVSYGLMVDVDVNQRGGPGQVVELEDSEDLTVSAVVRGPRWSRAEVIELWINGTRRITEVVKSELAEHNRNWAGSGGEIDQKGVLARKTWRIPRHELSHDLWLSVVARGKGITEPFWPCAKPYQPDSIHFEPYVFSCTGPAQIDVDGDGAFSSPSDLAEDLLSNCGLTAGADDLDWSKLASRLAAVDESVVVQVLFHLQARSLEPGPLWEEANGKVRMLMHRFDSAWRESVRARLEGIE